MTSRPVEASPRSVADHRDQIERMLRSMTARPVESVPVSSALGRQTAEDVSAPIDLPVFRNSAMDGYAVRATDVLDTPATLPLTGTIAAGAGGHEPLAPGTARKVMTGAPLPTGADCVVPVEDADAGEETVTIERGRHSGEFVRDPGTDIRAGALLVGAGTQLQPRHIAALAALGLATVPVRRPIRAGIVTTGDELVEPGTALAAGQIFDSNGIALAAALRTNGVEVTVVEHSTDDQQRCRQLLDKAIELSDVVFTSGGISKGDFEVVRDVLEPLGGHFGPVAVQPGGPQGLIMAGEVPILSFPGNPVSTMVSFEVFARPALRRLSGMPPVEVFDLPLRDPISSPVGRRQYLRGRVDRTDGPARAVEVVSGPGSHLIASMATADVLIEVPEAVTDLAEDDIVRVWTL